MEAVVEDDGTKVAGIYQLDGKINRRPKAWLRAVRREVARLEQAAREAGCDELRIAGRDWSRVLPGFERMTDAPQLRNGLRKVLR